MENIEWQLLQRFERGDIGVELNILRLSIPKFSVQIVQKTAKGEWRPRAPLSFRRENGVVHLMALNGLVNDMLKEAEARATDIMQDAEDAYWQMKNDRDAQREARMKAQGGSLDENRRRIKQQKLKNQLR